LVPEWLLAECGFLLFVSEQESRNFLTRMTREKKYNKTTPGALGNTPHTTTTNIAVLL